MSLFVWVCLKFGEPPQSLIPPVNSVFFPWKFLFGDRSSFHTPCFRPQPTRQSRQTDRPCSPPERHGTGLQRDAGAKTINWFQKLLLFTGFRLIVGRFFEYFLLWCNLSCAQGPVRGSTCALRFSVLPPVGRVAASRCELRQGIEETIHCLSGQARETADGLANSWWCPDFFGI